MEQCTAQGELRQRRAKSEVQHVKRRLEKNEAASAALLKQVRDNEREKQILLQECQSTRYGRVKVTAPLVSTMVTD